MTIPADDFAYIRAMIASVDGGDPETTKEAKLQALDALMASYRADEEDVGPLEGLVRQVEAGKL